MTTANGKQTTVKNKQIVEIVVVYKPDPIVRHLDNTGFYDPLLKRFQCRIYSDFSQNTQAIESSIT